MDPSAAGIGRRTATSEPLESSGPPDGLPGSARSLAIGVFLVASLLVIPRAPSEEVDRPRPLFENRHLFLEVEVAPNRSSYRVRSRFAYRARAQLSQSPFFVFPGVETPADVEVRLDGKVIDPSRLLVEPHPGYSGKNFRLPVDSRAADHPRGPLSYVAYREGDMVAARAPRSASGLARDRVPEAGRARIGLGSTRGGDRTRNGIDVGGV